MTSIIALLYHDVVGPEGYGSSGFYGGDADIYKLSQKAFLEHMRALSAAAHFPGHVEEAVHAGRQASVILTFDDGGAGALPNTAPVLEDSGWKGHFFVTTNRIGTSGFLAAADIRELHARGHAIGTHTCSHPVPMSRLPYRSLLAEWGDSRRRLEDILGAEVLAGSVPGGFYSRRVARAAAESGLRFLFNSEPTVALKSYEDCVIVGRFSIMRHTPPGVAADLAAGALLPRWRQAAAWNAKKGLKVIGGQYWLRARRWLLRERHPSAPSS
jgi:peptidoglycan/xylan/chitin deacetylase (PgdA/CDA1 family)